MRWLVYIFFGLLVNTNVFAQQPNFWQYTSDNGLPSNTVYDLFQDSKGFIWFGTEVGLCKYDGKFFKLIPFQNARSNGVTRLQEDKQGNIWCHNFSGQIFFINNDKAQEFPLSESFKNRNTQSFIIDESQNLWTHDSKIIGRYQISTKKWKIWDIAEYANNDEIVFNAIIDFDANSVLINTYNKNNENAIWYLDNERIVLKKRFPSISKENPGSVYKASSNKILSLHNKESNNYPSTTKYLGYLNVKTLMPEKIVEIPISKSSFVQFISEDKEENYWICTSTGAFVVDKNLKFLFGGKKLFPDKSISSVLQDKEGNYWISTIRDGVFLMPSKNIWLFNSQNSVLPTNQLNKLAFDDKNRIFWASSDGKVGFYENNRIIFRDIVGEKINSGVSEALYFDTKKQKLLLGCGGTFIFDRNLVLEQKKFIGVIKGFDTFRQKYIVTVSSTNFHLLNYEDIKKTPDGVFPQNILKKAEQPENQEQQYVSINPKRHRCVLADNENNLVWRGNVDGLFYIDFNKNQEFELKDGNKHIIAQSLAKIAGEIILVGTMQNGLYVVKNNKLFEHFTTENGLISNYINTIRYDGKYVWVGSNAGIQRILLKQKEFVTLDTKDGLPTNEINDFVIQNDTVFVATAKGLVVFPKNIRLNNAFPPQIFLEGFKIWDKKQPLKETYELLNDQNNIEILFQGLAFRSQGKFRYKYKMVGIDTSWIYTESSNNYARYPTLPHGNFEFQVKSINEDGVESEGTALLTINIVPPFWSRWWFLASIFILFGIVIFIVFKLRIKNIQRKNTIEQALINSQLSALKVQMNPHFIFNALNSIQEFILMNEKRMANQFLGKFSDLMRLTLDMSNEPTVMLEDEIKILNLYLELEKVRFEDLDYEIKIDESLTMANIHIPSMLVQPYIENALKHGLLHKKNNRRLCISMQLNTENYLDIQIQDNGIGREKSMELKKQRLQSHKSFAMSATEKRLELLNYGRKQAIMVQIQDLKDENNLSEGTKVSIKVPIQNT